MNSNGNTPRPVRQIGIEHIDRVKRLIVFVGPPEVERLINAHGLGHVEPDFKNNTYRLSVDSRLDIDDVLAWLEGQDRESAA